MVLPNLIIEFDSYVEPMSYVPVSNLTDFYLVRHGNGTTFKLRLTLLTAVYSMFCCIILGIKKWARLFMTAFFEHHFKIPHI